MLRPVRATRRCHRCRWLCRAALLLASLHADAGAAELEWEFNPALLRGSGVSGQTLNLFNRRDALLPGIWSLQLYVNDRFVARLDVRLAENAQGQVQPCLPRAIWLRAGIDPEYLIDAHGDCPEPSAQVPGSSYRIDSAQLRLALSVPQAMLRRSPHSAVPVAELDAGRSLVFFNYMGNLWHARNHATPAQTSGFVSLAGGANIGLWQYRQQGNLSVGSGRRPHWRNLSSAVQRPLPTVARGSLLSVGRLYTSGYFFSGQAYEGITLASDPRVLTDQQRGFAPLVRGTANSNARISIRQKGREIYQTTVAPGAFVIDDLAPTSYDGDLEVVVEEANGTTHRFRVPFSALPESLRPGHWRYALSAGRTRNQRDHRTFADASTRRGISNAFSTGAGVRLAPGYQALAADAVLLSRAGAVGINLSHSRASVPGSGSDSGWMAGLSYSRSFAPTDTHLAIATYRYSSSGYRNLNDAPDVRDADNGVSLAARQRARLEVSLNQPLGGLGQAFVSASSQNWHHSPRHEHQWQLGYGTTWGKGMSLNLSLMRTQTAHAGSGVPGSSDTVANVSLSIPLGAAAPASLSVGYNRSRLSNQVDADISGHLGSEASYSVGLSHALTPRQSVWHGSLQQRLPSTSIGINASYGAQHWQAAANVQGALALHAGGATFGPWLGDTFALIEAKGATGALVGGSGQARIDRNGYALMPALAAYRYNRVFLDPQGAADAVELDGGEQRVAPYAGAAVRLRFHTRRGQALLIHVLTPGAQTLPPGTEALDADGRSIGLIGQGNWLYLRSDTTRGQVQLRWGESAAERCHLAYDGSHQPEASLIRLQAACLPE